jgi:hypothetical protein
MSVKKPAPNARKPIHEEKAHFVRLQLVEASGSKSGKIIARGEFARHDKPTENGRFYKRELWDREIARLTEAMESRRVYGELDHPADGRTKLQRVSHLMTGMTVEEDGSVTGEAEILDTPNGRILKAIIEAGGAVGVSSRGYGSVKTAASGDAEEVGEDFVLETFDFVADPADRTAYPEIFSEERAKIPESNMELTIESLKKDYPGLVSELEESAKRTVVAASRVTIQESTERAKVQTEERLKEEFTSRLMSRIEELRAEAIAQVKAEMLADPKIGGASKLAENIAALIAPNGAAGGAGGGEPSEWIEKIAKKDEEIGKLKEQLAGLNMKIEQAAKDYQELESTAREVGYQLHIERKIGADPSGASIKKMIGSVKEFRSLDDIDKRIEAVKKELGGQQQRASAQTQAVTQQKLGLEAELKSLRAKVAESKEREIEAQRIAKEALVAAYTEQKIGGHPEAKKLRSLCEGAGSEREVDRIIAGYRAAPAPVRQSQRTWDADEARNIHERIRRGAGVTSLEETRSIPRRDVDSGASLVEDAINAKPGELERLMGQG